MGGVAAHAWEGLNLQDTIWRLLFNHNGRHHRSNKVSEQAFIEISQLYAVRSDEKNFTAPVPLSHYIPGSVPSKHKTGEPFAGFQKAAISGTATLFRSIFAV